MSFASSEFIWFFVGVVTAYWLVPSRRWQNVLLLGVSAVFYGWVHPWFLLLLYGSAVVDYSVSLAMARRQARRGLLLAISVVTNLGLLGVFKYLDFFIENFIVALQSAGVTMDLRTLGIFLPVGISFYTFQTMSYSIDVYRGEVQARKSFIDYVVYVSFFPQLVAGPIERAGRLLPQIETARRFEPEALVSGLSLAAWGAFKKIAIADTIAAYVDRVFVLDAPAPALVWAASLGFAIQLLADFSGYTDIARGTARMLGFELMVNFNHPYLATSLPEFWRRWHISLSFWVRDYLFIPLRGAGGNAIRGVAATFITFVLIGFWHGASWTFIAWGAFHGALIVASRAVRPRIPDRVKTSTVGKMGAVVLTFTLVAVSMPIFREPSIGRVVDYFTTNPFTASPQEWIAVLTLLTMCALVSLPLFFALFVELKLWPLLKMSPWRVPLQTFASATFLVGASIFVRDTSNDFIYFQF